MGEVSNTRSESRSDLVHMDGGKCGFSHRICFGISAYESNSMKSKNPHSGIYEAETARTLDMNGGNPACNQGGMMIVEIREP